MNDKMCPLLSGGSGKLIKCQADRCAWYCPAVNGDGGRCAVLDLVSVTAGVMYPYMKEQDNDG